LLRVLFFFTFSFSPLFGNQHNAEEREKARNKAGNKGDILI
jgi:hypothetical protein